MNVGIELTPRLFGERLVFVNIKLVDIDLTSKQSLYIFDNGHHPFAMWTPRCIKLNQNDPLVILQAL